MIDINVTNFVTIGLIAMAFTALLNFIMGMLSGKKRPQQAEAA